MAKGGMLRIAGRPQLLMEGRGRRGARMSLDSDWFALDRDKLIVRLLEFGYSQERAEKEANAFMEYRGKLKNPAPKTETEKMEEPPDEVARQWQDAIQRRASDG